MKNSSFLCIAAILVVFVGRGALQASGQTSPTGQPVVVPTPTPGPVGTASTALNSSGVTSGGVRSGQGSMGTGIQAPVVGAPAAVPPVVPGQILINANANSVGTGNVAGSVQFNNGGPGSVSSAPVPISPVPTYVTPGTGLGTPVNSAVTVPNPNPGSVQ